VYKRLVYFAANIKEEKGMNKTMNRLIALEAVIVVVLIIIISVIPSRSTSAYQDASSAYEHTKSTVQAEIENIPTDVTATTSPTSPTEEPTATPEEDTQSVIAASRAVGGYTAYVNGTFTEPTPFPTEEASSSDDSDNTDNDTDNESGSDGSDADASSDNQDDTDNALTSESGDDVTWTKIEADSDEAKTATLLGTLYFRTTPSKQTEDNIITKLDEGLKVNVVTELVESTDPDVKNWMEVEYNGQTGYIVKKYTEINQ
jgi:hypothetical protein